MKIEEQVLSREQMAHLVELGIDTSDASMCWIADDSYLNFIPDNNGESEVKWKVAIPSVLLLPYSPIPTYTIGDLIEKLPKDIEGSCLDINYIYSEIVYKDILHYDFEGVGLLNTLYAVLCWVAENHKELIK